MNLKKFFEIGGKQIDLIFFFEVFFFLMGLFDMTHDRNGRLNIIAPITLLLGLRISFDGRNSNLVKLGSNLILIFGKHQQILECGDVFCIPERGRSERSEQNGSLVCLKSDFDVSSWFPAL